jgi:hypothetical protein
MAETTTPRRWRYGLHPAAAGSSIASMTRIDLPIGEALRVEMRDATSDGPTHLQVYIATESGGWAMWASGSPDELAELEGRLPALVSPTPTDAPA